MSDGHHHAIEACFNAGWDDDPAWKVICDCAWECWDQPTELAARSLHREHRAELLLTGKCSCPTCRASSRGG